MKILTTAVLMGAFSWTLTNACSDKITRICQRAAADGIDLPSFPFADAAFASIEAISTTPINTILSLANATKIDTHVHAAPDWYVSLVPGNQALPTSNWSIPTSLQFMADNGIKHSVMSISTPGTTVYPGNETLSVGLGRLLNEYLAELVRVFPEQYSFYAATPLPYVNAALREVKYALGELGAAGIGLLTNHEGLYMGDPNLRPFFAGLDALESTKKLLFIHPTFPASSPNPRYSPGVFEFYFETARNLADMTLTQTLHNFTSLRYVISHMGGAFPSIQDRFLARNGALYNRSQTVYNTRLWYDSAGATFPHQVQGLLAYGLPTSQLVYGSDFAYTLNPYAAVIRNISTATFLSDAEKRGLFHDNALALFPDA